MKWRFERPRVVFDCNTLVQAALAFSGPSAACLRLVESGRADLFTSRSTTAELRRVLTYKDILALNPDMTPERIGAFMARLSYRAKFATRVAHVFDYPRDKKDEPYMDLAIHVRADFLVSYDRDLLDLMTGHTLICRQFRRGVPAAQNC